MTSLNRLINLYYLQYVTLRTRIYADKTKMLFLFWIAPKKQ